MENGSYLELRSASLRRGGTTIFDGTNLSFARGRVTMVMGGAGSGKSSLLKLAAGIFPPDGGEILFEGRSIWELSRRGLLAFHRRCGFVFQDAALWSNRSLHDNIAFPLRFHEPRADHGFVEDAVARAAQRAGYSGNLSLRPAEVSGGERRLAGLARALVLDPELLFLDEPTVSLGEEEADRVIGLVEGLGKRGRTVIVASSNPEMAFRAADDIVAIAEGRVLARGDYEEASGWLDPALRAAVGKLRTRARVDGLLGAWANTMADEGVAGWGRTDIDDRTEER